MLYRAELLSPAKVKEKALKALFARKLMERAGSAPSWAT